VFDASVFSPMGTFAVFPRNKSFVSSALQHTLQDPHSTLNSALLASHLPPVTVMDYYPSSFRLKHRLEVSAPIENSAAGATADIGWSPDVAKFKERSAARPGFRYSNNTVPKGWPMTLDGQLVWSGEDLQNEESYVYELSQNHKVEIGHALSRFKGKLI
jgi:hypothetical protein